MAVYAFSSRSPVETVELIRERRFAGALAYRDQLVCLQVGLRARQGADEVAEVARLGACLDGGLR